MNILIIVSSLTGGGAERVAACWANGLSNLGNDVSVMTNYSLPITYELNNNIRQINFPILSSNKISRLFIDPIRKIKYYHNIIKDLKIDVVITVLHITPIIKLALLGLKNKPLFILTDHNAYERPKNAPMSRSQYFSKFYLNKIYDYITVLTERDKEILNSHNFTNVEVLHNPLFLTPQKISSDKKENIILAVGRMDIWECKGFDLLINAWNKIYSNYPEWKLRIVGSASKEALHYLQQLKGKNTSIELVNYTKEINLEYEKASIFVLSSRYEGWGLVLVEALSQSCACIACDYNGRQAEIIQNNKNGILIKTDNVDDLENAIKSLIDNQDLREKLQQTAPDSVMHFSETETAINWMNLLSKLKNNQ